MDKFKQVLIILICLSSLTSAFLFYQNLQLQKQIAVLQSPVSLLVKPSPSPSLDPTADWKKYTNSSNQFSFKYPSEYTVTSQPTFTTIKTNVESFMVSDTDTPEKFNYYIQISLDPQSNFDTWTKYESTQSLGTEKINGYNFEKYIVADMYLTLNYIYKDPNGLIYRFMLGPYDNIKTPNDLTIKFDQILSTFKFTESEKAVCKPTYEVIQTPELSAEQTYSQECLNKDNESDCLKVDIYNLSQKDFSKPDGIPDCKWTKSN
ncbi:MAG: hypothetical protein NTZ93_04605 [Candidatus Beckwithbacteria bacterium]|nr:hypothetical protein [Candidatus Beckwithbacteria bacterium]